MPLYRFPLPGIRAAVRIPGRGHRARVRHLRYRCATAAKAALGLEDLQQFAQTGGLARPCGGRVLEVVEHDPETNAPVRLNGVYERARMGVILSACLGRDEGAASAVRIALEGWLRSAGNAEAAGGNRVTGRRLLAKVGRCPS
ncbi:hypothetical protein AB0G77_34010 [Streptomyces hygroscopicus]|uniref:hypothetical protein n=1 Tax=Streptomyces hygroscopicus TaxID=1912 RepID=UPI0033D52D6F